MRGLLKYLSPFAPDQSGATSVLYDLGGILVICDAGGCTGNICGFDEPRWFGQKSAIFSAGLRDMDAILGRDDKLVAKLKKAVGQVGGDFVALIGTPVPAVIATDYRALKKMAADTVGLPVIGIECKGTALYDEGAQSAWCELFDTFTEENADAGTEAGGSGRTLGVIGMTPLDISTTHPQERMALPEHLQDYDRVWCYGMGAGLDEAKKAGAVERNYIVSPAALKAARTLEKRFGTPYETGYPFFTEEEKQRFRECAGRKVLVIHQQMAANEIRRIIEAEAAADGSGDGTQVVCGTWFMQDREFRREGDVHFTTEEKFREYVLGQDFDVIIGDPLLRRAVREYTGTYLEIGHYAISGYQGE